MELEKGTVLTPEEEKMFIKGLKQSLIHIDKIRDMMEDPSQPEEVLEILEQTIWADILRYKAQTQNVK